MNVYISHKFREELVLLEKALADLHVLPKDHCPSELFYQLWTRAMEIFGNVVRRSFEAGHSLAWDKFDEWVMYDEENKEMSELPKAYFITFDASGAPSVKHLDEAFVGKEHLYISAETLEELVKMWQRNAAQRLAVRLSMDDMVRTFLDCANNLMGLIGGKR